MAIIIAVKSFTVQAPGSDPLGILCRSVSDEEKKFNTIDTKIYSLRLFGINAVKLLTAVQIS
jgi:hypothetical protein